MDGSAPGLAAIDAEVRLAYITRSLDRAHHNAWLFERLWGGVFAVGAVGSVGLGYLVDDKAFATGQYVSGGKSFIALISTFVLPLRIRRVRKNDPRDVCTKLVDAEAAFRWSAVREKKKKGLLEFVEGLALNLSGTAFLGFRYGYWREAIAGSILGTSVGLFRMYTAPKTARNALGRYKAGTLGTSAPAAVAWAISPWVARRSSGMSLTLVW